MAETTYHQKPVDELTFTDDGMFQAVLRNKEICAELVERLLHIKVGHIEYPELEKPIKPFYTTKGVRIDVYLKDNEKKNPYGLPCYTFQNVCKENAIVNLNDKSLKVIYNASAYSQEKDEKIKAFLHYISTNEPGEDDFSNRLSDLVEIIKDNEIFRSDYAAMNLHDRDIMRLAKKEGREEGALQKAIETAANMLNDKIPVENIARYVDLPLEKVEELADKLDINEN